jgi:MoxR-like ATPase
VTRSPQLSAVTSGEELLALRTAVDQVFVSPAVQEYILALVRATRAMAVGAPGKPATLTFGASPRASLALYQSARALAWLRGQDYVSPSIVQELVPDVLRHRIGLSYEAEARDMTPDSILDEVVATTRMPQEAAAERRKL